MQQTLLVRQPRSITCWAWFLSAALLATACQSTQRPVETPEQHAARIDRERAACRAFFDNLTVRVGRRLDQRATERGSLDVLVLSGGGDFGAFGAGFLQGWGQVADPAMRRPEFDAVFGTKPLNGERVRAWNAFLLKRGLEDEVSAELEQAKHEAGWGGRADIRTFVDFHDVDEGRTPVVPKVLPGLSGPPIPLP